jgi:sugar lactone lactonase YvrE
MKPNGASELLFIEPSLEALMNQNYQILTSELFYASSSILGEGCFWHPHRKTFFWIDIEERRLSEIDTSGKQVNFWVMPQRIGTAVPVQENPNNLLVALQDGLAVLDLETGYLEWLMDLEKDLPDNRANDGKCDGNGRLWLGTMGVKAQDGVGSLYRIKGTEAQKMLSNLTISNGMAWSANNRFYFIDSPTKRIDSYLFASEAGNIEFEKTVIEVPDDLGLPDGMTIDEEGMLWVAHWDGFAVCRWNPNTGELLAKIVVPVPQVTCCAFGGKDLQTLIITTAKKELSHGDLAKYPLSGHLFTVQVDVKGLEINLFKK